MSLHIEKKIPLWAAWKGICEHMLNTLVHHQLCIVAATEMKWREWCHSFSSCQPLQRDAVSNHGGTTTMDGMAPFFPLCSDSSHMPHARVLPVIKLMIVLCTHYSNQKYVLRRNLDKTWCLFKLCCLRSGQPFFRDLLLAQVLSLMGTTSYHYVLSSRLPVGIFASLILFLHVQWLNLTRVSTKLENGELSGWSQEKSPVVVCHFSVWDTVLDAIFLKCILGLSGINEMKRVKAVRTTKLRMSKHLVALVIWGAT